MGTIVLLAKFSLVQLIQTKPINVCTLLLFKEMTTMVLFQFILKQKALKRKGGQTFVVLRSQPIALQMS